LLAFQQTKLEKRNGHARRYRTDQYTMASKRLLGQELRYPRRRNVEESLFAPVFSGRNAIADCASD